MSPEPPAAERFSLEWDERGGVTVHMDGSPQSHVQPDDPTLLVFEYVQHLALAIAALPPGPLGVTHVGGAGLTLPRWVEATRPGSTQIVLEPDAALTELVRREIPLPRRHRIRVRPVDGLTGARALKADSADVVVTDAYAGGRVPAELVGTAYVDEVARVLRTDGVALWNLADEPGLRWVARVVATAADRTAARRPRRHARGPQGTPLRQLGAAGQRVAAPARDAAARGRPRQPADRASGGDGPDPPGRRGATLRRDRRAEPSAPPAPAGGGCADGRPASSRSERARRGWSGTRRSAAARRGSPSRPRSLRCAPAPSASGGCPSPCDARPATAGRPGRARSAGGPSR